MIECIKAIYGMLGNELHKPAYHSLMKTLDETVVATLTKNGFYQIVDGKLLAPESEEIGLTIQSTKLRQDIARKQLDEFEDNPTVGLESWAKTARSTMYDFLEKYHIGYLDEMNIRDGLLHVKICCNISVPFTSNKISAKKKLEDQLQTLQDIGLELVHSDIWEDNYNIAANDTNYHLLNDYLEKRGAINLVLEYANNHIDTISFLLPPQDIAMFAVEKVDYKLPVTDYINDDEKVELQKLLKETAEVIGFAASQPNMKETCWRLTEMNISAISTILQYDGVIKERINQKFKQEREANENIRAITTSIGKQFDAAMVPTLTQNIKDNLNDWAMTTIGFAVEHVDIATAEYGASTASMRFISQPNCYFYRKASGPIVHTTPNHPFELIKVNDSYFMLNTEHNLVYIRAMLGRQNMGILDMSVGMQNNQFIIKKITATINNIQQFI